MSHRIELSAIDPRSFLLLNRKEGVLVQPLRTKLTWREDELPLRSLLLDGDGRVRSAGWPKFFNRGENSAHDAIFDEALASGRVEFTEKLDGMLLIADHGGLLRTRGQSNLGEFDGPVRSLITSKHPGLDGLLSDPEIAHLSLLFEFVSPEYTVVIPYGEPAMHFLGAVDKRTLSPVWGDELDALVERRAGIRPAPVHAMPTRLDELLDRLASMRGKEGLVARFSSPDGARMMLKLKTDEYVRLHGSRGALGERGSKRLAFLLDITSEADASPALARVGLDHETITYALHHLRPYFARRAAASPIFASLKALAASLASLPRRDQVERLRAALPAPPGDDDLPWLAVAIKMLDGRADDAWLMIEARLLDEPVPTLRSWLRDRDRTVAAMIAAVPAPATV